MTAAHVGNALARHELLRAREAWSTGHWTAARSSAQRALAGALGTGDRHVEALASLLLAQSLALESRFEWAQRFARTAKLLFHRIADPAGVCEALFIRSYAESAIGCDDAALRSASQAVSLSQQVQHLSAAGLNYVGVASFWRGDYGTARGVLDAAAMYAPEHAKNRAAAFQPLVNAAFTELLRCVQSQLQGKYVDLSELERLVADARRLEQQGITESLSQAALPAGLFLLEFESFYVANVLGNAAQSDRHYLACCQRAIRLPQNSWMQGLLRWAQMERARAARDARKAAVIAQAFASICQAGEHAHMESLARRLRSSLRPHGPGTALRSNSEWQRASFVRA